MILFNKILIVSCVSESDNNGLAVVFKSFLKYLRELNYRFSVLNFSRALLSEERSLEEPKTLQFEPLSTFDIFTSIFYKRFSDDYNKLNDYLIDKDMSIIFFGSTYDPIIDYLSLEMHRKVFVHCNDSIYLYETRRITKYSNVLRRVVSKYIERQRLNNDKLTLIYVGKMDFVISRNLSSRNNAVFLPLGVDSDKFFPVKYEEVVKKVVLFTGDLRYQPNYEAVELLVNRILPRLHKDYVLHIVGRMPSVELINLCKVDRVFLFPDVDDISIEYQKAFVFVAPMFSGAGMKNKILEALSCAVPVVTTNIEKHSFISNPDGVIFCDSIVEIITQINSLLDNPGLREKLSSEARSHVKENYSWELRNRKLLEILQKN